jgi:hypothetical protein
MAKFKMNKMVEKATGTVGTMSFRTVGKTILFSSNPDHNGRQSEKQRLQRERFKRASTYAKTVLADPATKAAYAEKAASSGVDFMNAFSLAVKDYLKSPVVDAMDYSAYKGKIGDLIKLRVFDEFKVAEVRVSIVLPTSVVSESGVAIHAADAANYTYIATKANTTLAGSKIVVVVTDKPGNTTTFEKVV